MGFFPSGSETQLGSLFLQGMQLVLEGAHRFCWYSPIECQKVHDRDIAYCIANDRIEDWKIIVINTYKAPAVPFGYHKSRSQTTDRTWFSRKTDPDIYTPWCDCRRIRYLNSWSIDHNCLPSVEELSDVLSNNPRHPLKYKTMFHRMFRHFVFDFLLHLQCIISQRPFNSQNLPFGTFFMHFFSLGLKYSPEGHCEMFIVLLVSHTM